MEKALTLKELAELQLFMIADGSYSASEIKAEMDKQRALRDKEFTAWAHSQAAEAEEDYVSGSDIEARDFHNACGDR